MIGTSHLISDKNDKVFKPYYHKLNYSDKTSVIKASLALKFIYIHIFIYIYQFESHIGV